MRRPEYIAHADWGTDPKKRQVAVAERSGDSEYAVVSIAPATPADRMDGDLRLGLNVADTEGGQLLAGFDFPIGLPREYAARAGIGFFPDFLFTLGHHPWDRFSDVANDPSEIGLHRPYYPARPGGTRQSHLYEALGMTRQQLRRRCEGNDAETLFWTLGGKQVGKAALAGWHYLIPVASARYWPFHGPLADLLDEDHDGVIVTETYPREFYRHFRSRPDGQGSKRKRTDRLRWTANLLGWAAMLEVTWQPEIQRRVEAGFSDGINGEDEFDAVVGLLGMIAVATGAMRSGEPPDDPAVFSVEGWILGRTAEPALF
jgi:hypothetical protein